MRVFSWTSFRHSWNARITILSMVQIHRWYFLYMDSRWRKIFLNSLNEFDPCVKFTNESDKESIVFFDIKVSLRSGKVFTNLYVKPTDRHQYLHYLSAHSYHTKKWVVFSQTLRISRLCSSKKDFEDHKIEMKSWFKKREYPENQIRSEMNKVKFSNFRPKNSDKNHNMKGIPLAVTYHPLLNPFKTEAITSPLICVANQWTGFCVVTASSWKG